MNHSQSILFLTILSIAISISVLMRKHLLSIFTIPELLLMTQCIITICMILLFLSISQKKFIDKVKKNYNAFLLSLLLGGIIFVCIYLNEFIIANYTLSNMYMLKTIFVLISIFLSGAYYFKEDIHIRQWIAMLFFIIGILLMYSVPNKA